MAAKYRKLMPKFWNDERIRELPQLGMLMAVYLLTGQSNRIGLFPFSKAMGAEALKMSPTAFERIFGDVIEKLGWQWDDRARVLWIPTWFKYNEPQNPKHLIGCLKDLDEVPTTPLTAAFLASP